MSVRDALAELIHRWFCEAEPPASPFDRDAAERILVDPDARLAFVSILSPDLASLLRVAEAARECAAAQDALDEHDVTHEEWNTRARAPFAARLSIAFDDLRDALAALPKEADRG